MHDAARAGKLVSYNTDLVSAFAMCTELSQRILGGPGKTSYE
jgi:hypothetical protein